MLGNRRDLESSAEGQALRDQPQCGTVKVEPSGQGAIPYRRYGLLAEPASGVSQDTCQQIR
jgi:hypothetical protein